MLLHTRLFVLPMARQYPPNIKSLDFEILDDSSELEEYSEYCRRELPLVVRAAIEEIARSEVEPLEERLMGQLDNIIRRAQDRVFANYRSAVADCVAGSSGMGDHQQSNAAPLSTSVALQSGQSKGSLSTASPAVEQTMSHIQAQADETSSDPSISSNHSSTTDNLLPRLSHESNEDDFEDFIHVPRALGMPQIQDSGAMQLEMEWLNADESFLYPGNLDLDKAYAGDFQGNHFGIAGSHWPPLPP
ncbi:hypothetical protein BKA64DRAFT_357404 [Cadophora sp. MPI-SDFR-AT-0126]|nr:hypothetical protein BKA64DRAFT_357404 [Leotiomycetes sp. MPI-SDFR-AT-0126]